MPSWKCARCGARFLRNERSKASVAEDCVSARLDLGICGVAGITDVWRAIHLEPAAAGKVGLPAWSGDHVDVSPGFHRLGPRWRHLLRMLNLCPDR